ncbi:transmembrane protein 176B [Tiliqua scincoides]|uniref:transmembrane protein 176B n=1 Tax=Tiliqua scincoides TaxID=71010 RepID=UPI0034636AC5
MSAGLVTVNGTEATTKSLDGTVINISITQESSLSCLLKALAAARQQKPAPKPASPAPGAGVPGRSGGQKVLGAAQILLGVVCISLGVVISLERSYQWVIRTGAPFWMGSLFILSGVFSVVGESRGGSWVPVATFFNLGSVVAGAVALAEGVADIPSLRYSPSSFDYVCKPKSERPWWATPTPTPVYDWRVTACKDTLAGLSVMAASVHLLLLIYSIVALIIALICLGSGLRTLCCFLRNCNQAYVTLGDSEAPAASEYTVA